MFLTVKSELFFFFLVKYSDSYVEYNCSDQYSHADDEYIQLVDI